MNKKPLNITLPQHSVEDIKKGSKKTILHKRNPRIDRYFAAKKPNKAIVGASVKDKNKFMVAIKNIELTENDIILYI